MKSRKHGWSLLKEPSSGQDTSKNKSKEVKPVVQHNLWQKRVLQFSIVQKNLYAVRNERKNRNIVQRSFSDILFSKNIEQCFAKFCPDLVKCDPRTNSTLFPIYAFPFMVNYAFITTGKFYQSLILQSNLALVKHLNRIFVPRMGIGLYKVPRQAGKQIF